MLGNSTPLHMLRRASFLFFDYFDSVRGCAEKIPDEIIEQKFDLSSNDSILIFIFLMGLGCLARELNCGKYSSRGRWQLVGGLDPQPQVSTKQTSYAHLFYAHLFLKKFSFTFLK